MSSIQTGLRPSHIWPIGADTAVRSDGRRRIGLGTDNIANINVYATAFECRKLAEAWTRVAAYMTEMGDPS